MPGNGGCHVSGKRDRMVRTHSPRSCQNGPGRSGTETRWRCRAPGLRCFQCEGPNFIPVEPRQVSGREDTSGRPCRPSSCDSISSFSSSTSSPDSALEQWKSQVCFPRVNGSLLKPNLKVVFKKTDSIQAADGCQEKRRWPARGEFLV